MKNVDIHSCSYYSSFTYNKIFENSGLDASDSLNTLHMNIRGLETHFSDFLAYLSTFPIHFDVICLTYLETIDILCYIAYKYIRVLVGIVHKRLFILFPRCRERGVLEA